MHASETAARRLAADVPVSYVAFDLLHLDGRPTLELAYRERRGLLEELGLDGPHWRTPRYHAGDGPAMVEASGAQGLEGVVAKRLDSPYEPGRRSGAWIKIKHRRVAELVVGGWMPGEGGRRGRIGSLLAGFHDEDGTLLTVAFDCLGSVPTRGAFSCDLQDVFATDGLTAVFTIHSDVGNVSSPWPRDAQNSG